MKITENTLRGVEALVIFIAIALVTYFSISAYEQHVEYTAANEEHREYLHSKIDALEKKNVKTKELLLEDMNSLLKEIRDNMITKEYLDGELNAIKK